MKRGVQRETSGQSMFREIAPKPLSFLAPPRAERKEAGEDDSEEDERRTKHQW